MLAPVISWMSWGVVVVVVWAVVDSVFSVSRYSNITLREVAFPPIVVTILPPEFTLQQQEDDGKMLNFRLFISFLTVFFRDVVVPFSSPEDWLLLEFHLLSFIYLELSLPQQSDLPAAYRYWNPLLRCSILLWHLLDSILAHPCTTDSAYRLA